MEELSSVHEDDHQATYEYANFDKRRIRAARTDLYNANPTTWYRLKHGTAVTTPNPNRPPTIEWTNGKRTVRWAGFRNRQRIAPFGFPNRLGFSPRGIPYGSGVTSTTSGGSFPGERSFYATIPSPWTGPPSSITFADWIATWVLYGNKEIETGIYVLGACSYIHLPGGEDPPVPCVKVLGTTRPKAHVANLDTTNYLHYKVIRVSDGVTLFSQSWEETIFSDGLGNYIHSVGGFFDFNPAGTEAVLSMQWASADDPQILKIACPGISTATKTTPHINTVTNCPTAVEYFEDVVPFDFTSDDDSDDTGSVITATNTQSGHGHAYTSEVRVVAVSLGYTKEGGLIGLWLVWDYESECDADLAAESTTVSAYHVVPGSGNVYDSIVFSGTRSESNIGSLTQTVKLIMDNVELMVNAGSLSWTILEVSDPGQETINTYDPPDSATLVDSDFSATGSKQYSIESASSGKEYRILDIDLRRRTCLWFQTPAIINVGEASDSGPYTGSGYTMAGQTGTIEISSFTYDLKISINAGTPIDLGAVAGPSDKNNQYHAGRSLGLTTYIDPLSGVVGTPSGLVLYAGLGINTLYPQGADYKQLAPMQGQVCFDWNKKFWAVGITASRYDADQWTSGSKTWTIKDSTLAVSDITTGFGYQVQMVFG